MKDKLTNRLAQLSTFGFYLAVLFSGYLIISDILLKPSRVKTYPHHLTGYTVPVRIQAPSTEDTIIHYEHKSGNKSGAVQLSGVKEGVYEVEEYQNISSSNEYNKLVETRKYIVRNDNLQDSSDEFNNIDLFNPKGYVVLNPKNAWFKSILAIENYSAIVFILFILWHTKAFFRSLNQDFSFSRKITRRLWIIGNTILFYQIFNLIMSVIISYFFLRVEFTTSLSACSLITHNNYYTLYPYIPFNFGWATMGLALVVLSKLLNYGHNLQQENDLTI